jgi:hypothetical protein
MKDMEHNPKLTSAEMASIWTSYLNDTMAICAIKHFLINVTHKEIREVLEYALHLSEQHIKTITSIMIEASFPIPYGFTDQDVDLSAPRLFSDTFYLFYMRNMAQIGENAYTVAHSNSSRLDIRKFYTECIYSSAELMNRSVTLLQKLGLYVRAPYIPIPKQVDFVHKQSFLTGWLGDRRPLNAIEIMNLFFNLQRNAIGNSLLIGFAQVARSKEVQAYFVRGKEIASKHVEIFGSILREDDIPAAQTWDSEATSSTIAPFSDKLMLFHALAMNSSGVGYYGASMGTSQRRDIGAMYSRLIGEVAQYTEDGANIMINNAWMEQPPTAVDRDALVSNKK